MVNVQLAVEAEIHDAIRMVTKQAIDNGALGKTVEDAGAGMTNVYMTLLGYEGSILQCYPNGEYPYVYILIYTDENHDHNYVEHSIPIEDLPEFIQRDIFDAYCEKLKLKIN